jgi:hypothetical protein
MEAEARALFERAAHAIARTNEFVRENYVEHHAHGYFVQDDDFYEIYEYFEDAMNGSGFETESFEERSDAPDEFLTGLVVHCTAEWFRLDLYLGMCGLLHSKTSIHSNIFPCESEFYVIDNSRGREDHEKNPFTRVLNRLGEEYM